MKNVVLASMIFPDNSIPKCFTNKEIYEKFNEIKNEYNNDINNLLKENFVIENGKIKTFKGIKNINYGVCKGTEPIEFISSKNDGTARCLSIPNPLVQIPLNWYILNNKEIILEMQENERENFISNSQYYLTDGEIISLNSYYDNYDIIYIDSEIIQKVYKEAIRKKHAISNGKYYQMLLDISNCYNSIYTHILTWGLTDENEKTIMNNIDILIRNTNRGETRGIPIGPYTSGLIAEILLSKVDKAIINKIKNEEIDISYVRYIDDYNIYSDSKEKLENIVKYIFEKELTTIKLELNNSKTRIEEFPFLELPSQNIKTMYYLEKNIEKLKTRNIQDEEDDKALDIIESIIYEMNQSIKNSISSFKYFIKVLNLKIENKDIYTGFLNHESIEILIDYLINMMFKYNVLSEDISNLIITILENSNINKIEILKKCIKKCEMRKSTIRECIYVWLGYIMLKTKAVDKDITEYFCSVMLESNLGLIMSIEYLISNNLLIEKKKIIKEKFKEISNEIKQQYGDASNYMIWHSKYWLLLYTNEIRWKIHKITGFKDTIIGKTNLEKIENNDISKEKLNLYYILKKLDINFFKI